jgi:hypothetical protein
MIIFACPTCGHRMQVAGERVKQHVLCPACSRIVQVPSPADPAGSSGPVTQAPAAKQQGRSSGWAVLGSGCLGLFLGVLVGGLAGFLWALWFDSGHPFHSGGGRSGGVPAIVIGGIFGPVIGGFLGLVKGQVWGAVRDQKKQSDRHQ